MSRPENPPRAPGSKSPVDDPQIEHQQIAEEIDDRNATVLENWQRFVQGLFGVLALVGALFMAHYYAPPPPPPELKQRFQHRTRQIENRHRKDSQRRTVSRPGLPRLEPFPSEPVA